MSDLNQIYKDSLKGTESNLLTNKEIVRKIQAKLPAQKSTGSGFSISDFKTEISKNSFAKSSHGHVLFSPPKGLSDIGIRDIRDVLLRCDSFTLPAVWFNTDTFRPLGYGPTIKAPGNPQFDPWSCSFIVDSKGEIYKYFTSWFNLIQPFERKASDNFYLQSYRGDYITDISINTFDSTTNRILDFKLTECWPQMLQETSINWSDTNSLVRLSITFQYTDWTMKQHSIPKTII